MTKLKKLIEKILEGRSVSYEEAEALLLRLGFSFTVCGSHHVFRKKGFGRNLSLKRRSELLSYQLRDIQEVLREYDCKEER